MTPKESEILQNIKSLGCWRVEIRPIDFIENKITLTQCREVLKKCQVRKRGWYYPHLSQKTEEFFAGPNYVETLVDKNMHLEFGRFYRSGQFIHHLMLWEEKEPEFQRHGKIQEIVMTMYTVTEVFLFALRLIREKIIKDKIYISLQLYNTLERRLYFHGRFTDLLYDCKCMTDSIKFERTYAVNDFKNKFDLFALDATMEIFEQFNSHNQDLRVSLSKEQKEFLTGND